MALDDKELVDYDQLSRAALIQLLQGYDESLADAGKDGIVMNYTGRAAPWQITRMVKPKLRKDRRTQTTLRHRGSARRAQRA